MKYDELLNKLTEENNGVLTTKDAVALGVTKPAFQRFVEKNGYERVAHGIYQSPDDWPDDFYVISRRSERAVFSHGTALYLHNMTDREPLKYAVTVPTGYNPTKLAADDIKVYTVKKELYGLGLTECETMYGNKVRVYDPERTVVDIVRNRNGIEFQTSRTLLKGTCGEKIKTSINSVNYASSSMSTRSLSTSMRVML